MKRLTRTAVVGVILVGTQILGAAWAEEQVFRSQPVRATLIELYSSEGCSSCPPAESWLGGLRKHPRLWDEIIPVAFHIDYWDHLGWKDPRSSKAYTDRQVAYTEYWKQSRLSTPMFVVGGQEWRSWFTSRQIPKRSTELVGVLEVATDEGRLVKGSFQPQGFTGQDLRLHVAVLGFGIVSEITAGENRGKNLMQNFVVLDYEVSSMQADDTGRVTGKVNLGSQRPTSARQLALAAWVTRKDGLVPVQATGGFLQ